jgi:hypothetical protein
MSEGINLSEQSADEAKPSNETSLDTEAHSTAGASTGLGGGRRRAGTGTTEMHGLGGERFEFRTKLTWS